MKTILGKIASVVLAPFVWLLTPDYQPRKSAVVYSGALPVFTKHWEGCSLTAYQDVGGVWTIGYGHTKDVHAGQTITQERADELLTLDLEEACNAVLKYTHRNLTSGQLDALTDFVFNCGQHAYKTSHLRVLVDTKQDSKVPAELERWDHDGKHVIPGLLARRKAEAHLYG